MICPIDLLMTQPQFHFLQLEQYWNTFENILELVLLFHNECELLVRVNPVMIWRQMASLSLQHSHHKASPSGVYIIAFFLSFLRYEGRNCFLFASLMLEAIAQCWTKFDAKSMFNKWMSEDRWLLFDRMQEGERHVNFLFSQCSTIKFCKSFSWGSGFGLEWDLPLSSWDVPAPCWAVTFPAT